MHNRQYAIIHFRDLEDLVVPRVPWSVRDTSRLHATSRHRATPRSHSTSTTFDKVKNSCCRRMLRDRSPSSRLSGWKRKRHGYNHGGCIHTGGLDDWRNADVLVGTCVRNCRRQFLLSFGVSGRLLCRLRMLRSCLEHLMRAKGSYAPSIGSALSLPAIPCAQARRSDAHASQSARAACSKERRCTWNRVPQSPTYGEECHGNFSGASQDNTLEIVCCSNASTCTAVLMPCRSWHAIVGSSQTPRSMTVPRSSRSQRFLSTYNDSL